ncbi:flagellar hook-length control protein FliK [Helicobacter vulpis]|uniref:flagellar hook-length control protein FliK n=1 Tax=Helicobacter vulpis TaxID=2316076 RepID=UPI000EABDEC0|nr:flagellar hook-length control protein FliK [Helicobacter vulpis]
MAVNPIHLDTAKTPSKGKTPSAHKAVLDDKDAFKHLLAKQKSHLKASEDHTAAKKSALLAKLSKQDKNAPLDKTKAKQGTDIAHSPLAHLLDGKMPKTPESPKKSAKDTHLAKESAKESAPAKKTQEGAQLPENAKLSDIKKLKLAKKLGLNAIQHEKGVSPTKAQIKDAKAGTKAPLSTQNLLKMQEKSSASAKDKAPSIASKESPDSSPKPVSKPSNQTPTPKAPLSQLLEHQGVAQHKQESAKLHAQKLYGHTLPKDNETNDREIKQAFKEALVQFPPSIYAPQSPLHGPAKPALEKDKDEKSDVSALKENVSHAPIQHVQDKDLPKAPLIKETLKNFAAELKQELQDFKPPITKLSMELHPDKLGKVDVVIQQVGKNIQVSVSSSAPVAALLSSYNNELRHNLAQMGFNDVDVSFIAHNNTGHGSNHPQQQGQFQDHHPGQNNPSNPAPSKDTNAPPLRTF